MASEKQRGLDTEGFSLPVQTPNVNSKFPTSVYGNPFGGARDPEFYGHSKKFQIFGGLGDTTKSIATRSVAIQGILDQLNRESVPPGLMGALGASARQLGGARGAESFGNLAGGIQNKFRIGEDVYKSNLSQMLRGAYTLGGSLYGSAYRAAAIAKELSKQRDAAKTQQLQAIVGGAMKGLGIDKAGESDTTVGIIGSSEW